MQKAADQREVFLPAIKVWLCPPLVSGARKREARANATINRTPTAAEKRISRPAQSKLSPLIAARLENKLRAYWGMPMPKVPVSREIGNL